MEIKDFHQLINTKELVDIATMLDEENLFYFKAKYSPLEFLAYGHITETNNPTDSNPLVYIGDFECSPNHFLAFANYIIKKDQEYFLNINTAPRMREHLTNIHFKPELNYETSTNEWQRQVELVCNEFAAQNFSKIVLSRDVSFQCETNIQKEVINKILKHKNNQHNYHLYFKIKDKQFLSLTPERLFILKNNHIESMALAGSMPVSSDKIINEQYKQQLINDEKLILEHRLVTEEISRRFTFFSTAVTVQKLEIMELSYIQHRLQKIMGELACDKNILDVLHVLHPTPAVGTLPYENGIKIINQIEGRQRKFYAAPFGIISKHHTEFIVGLRSATISPDKFTMHTGCGIVPGSIAEKEWDETENKLKPFLQAII